METPFTVKTADAASRTLWDLHEEIKPDFPVFKILALHAHNAGQIHMVTKRVVKTDRRPKGMRIRFPSQAVKEMLGLSWRGAGRPAAGGE